MPPLSIADRKHLMPHGAQVQVASDEGVAESYVSAVMNDDVRPKTPASREKLARVQAALARKLDRPVEDVFPTKHEAATVAA
jgi:hypothetical protein